MSWSGSFVPDSRSGSRYIPPPSGSGSGRHGPSLPSEHFEVLGELGRGGMGAVYHARERHTGREVALKVILSPERNPKRLLRFRREAELAASLKHPGVVAVHSANLDDTPPWIAYELIPGAKTLNDGLRTAPLRVRVRWILETARAIAAAHEGGIVHRDLKPDNVLIDVMGNARVTDFGLAAHQAAERLTRSGALVGTPHYMAPEQIASDRDNQGPHTDVWALGVMLFEAIVGQRPFLGPTVLALGAQITSEPIPNPSSKANGIPPSWDHVVQKALSRPQRQRYRDAGAFADELERALQGERLGAGRRVLRRVSLVCALLATLAAVLVVLDGLRGRSGAVKAVRTLHVASLPPETARETLLVRGTVSDGVDEVLLEVNGASLTVPTPGGRLQHAVSLQLGSNLLRLSVAGGEAHSAKVFRVPTWWSTLQHERRPSVPLPRGMVFGDEPGDYLNLKDGTVLVWVPPTDEAVLGGRAGDMGATHFFRDATRRPITGFFMGKYEVSWSQVEAYFTATGQSVDLRVKRRFKKVGTSIDGSEKTLDTPLFAGDREPALRLKLSHYLGYAKWAGLRVPTEDEWEYAARGPDGRRFPYGDDEDPQRVNATGVLSLPAKEDGDRYLATAPVDALAFGRGPFGCLNMAGNAMELTTSCDPTADSNHAKRIHEGYVGRGGSWVSQSAYCNALTRFPIEDKGADHDLGQENGLRVARSPD